CADQQLERCAIATVHLELMRTIIRKPPISVVKQTDQVEQRSDVRVRLSVVIAEQAFVVTDQARVDVRTNHLPVVGESLGSGKLNCAVIAARRTKASCRGRPTGSGTSKVLGGETMGGITSAARVEEEVVISIVERT